MYEHVIKYSLNVKIFSEIKSLWVITNFTVQMTGQGELVSECLGLV
jgi:hypothetical protein